MDQACLNMVSARNDFEQAGIGCRLVIGILDQHSHFATDALQAHRLAQREACDAYVTRQRHAGWIVLPEMYDDGGLSGGTIERPALQRLLPLRSAHTPWCGPEDGLRMNSLRSAVRS